MQKEVILERYISYNAVWFKLENKPTGRWRVIETNDQMIIWIEFEYETIKEEAVKHKYWVPEYNLRFTEIATFDCK